MVRSVADPHKLKSLFRPGSGVLPPVLAGREAEIAALTAFRTDLLNGASIPRDMIIYGPRGNGKTVLVESFRRACANNGIPDAQFIDTYASSLSNIKAVHDTLLPVSMHRDLVRRLKTAKSVRALSVQVSLGDPKQLNVADALAARLIDGPLIMAIDEAHMLSVEVGRELLNASQAVRKRGLPFFLLLAGTPDIRSKMRKMGATFWGRSEKMPIGRLSSVATRQALTEPLTRFGLRFDAEALDLAMHDIVGYPYFVQLWGESLTNTKTDALNHPIVSVNDAGRASAVFGLKRNDYYRDRHEELRERNLLEVATAVSRASLDGTSMTRNSLSRIVSAELSKAQGFSSESRHAATEEVCEQLIEIGYVWQGSGDLEPGIPSLMDYVLDRDESETAPGADSPLDAGPCGPG